MASSKKPTYKVETKLGVERKRRKSDLVIMWHSICSVTITVVRELWITLSRMWDLIQLWFSSSERLLLETWLEKHLPFVPDDFSQSWRDGRLMAMLLNKLKPGCFPDANRLDPDYGLKNVYRVFDSLDIYFGIKPNVSVEEIVTCVDGSDAKLLGILLDLKNFTENQPENTEAPAEPEPKEKNDQSGQWQSSQEICIAKGTGLVVGFVGKITNFSIFCAVMSDLDVIVEIRGPNSVCSERITKRSPKKKRSVSSWEYSRPLTRSLSVNEDNDDHLITEEDENFENRIIPLEYEISGNQISLTYKPKEKGEHKITVLWHGQHILDSPYFVTVEDPSKITAINNVMHLKSALKPANESTEKSRKISVRFQESGVVCKTQKKSPGKILCRRVLRYIVKIHGKDIPVNAENTESLAAELLKMDYNFEKWPSFHRRNSWGFAGDAERKRSVIRQFGIDVNELDAQISQRRSRSLSLSPGSKKLLRKSDSFDSLTSNLNIVDEDSFENSEKAEEKEEDYAYINADSTINETSAAKCNEVHHPTSMQKETPELSSELTESKFVESLEENTSCGVETNKISSLSTNTTLTERVDNPDEDLQLNNPTFTPSPKLNETNVGKVNKCVFNYHCSNVKLHHGAGENEKAKNDPKTSEHLQRFFNRKITKRSSKTKNHTNNKYDQSHSLNKHRIKIKIGNASLQTFYRKISRNRNLISCFSDFRKFHDQMLKTKKIMPSKVFENLNTEDSMELKKERSENENMKLLIEARDFPVEQLAMTENMTTDCKHDATSGVNDAPVPDEMYIEKTEKNQLTRVNQTFKNVTHSETKTKSKASHSIAQELKTENVDDINHNLNAMATSLPSSNKVNNSKTKLFQTSTPKPIEQFFINHNLNTLPTCLSESKIESKDINVKRIKPLRTHTLKSIERLNFKQFNPSFETQDGIIGPVKLQIGHWESALSSTKEDASAQKLCKFDTEQVSVKEKLAFWENAYKTEQNTSPRDSLENNENVDLVRNKSLCEPTEDNSDAVRKNPHATERKSSPLESVATEKTETCISVNKEANLAAKTQADDKMSSELQLVSHKINRRSFSDPVILETAVDDVNTPVNIPCQEPSGHVYSSSSTEDNLEFCELGDSEDSGGDYILHSAEDEYIDDEISERASEYWGDLSIGKGWKVTRCTNQYLPLEEDFLQNYQRNKSYPEWCKVFGIAVYYGHVAVKNRFQVYTGDAGFGNLSVSMQGFRQHDVSLVSVAYVRNNIYEVIYQVMTAGYYLISIRWMDKEIPGSPFVCKVTF